jgi:hypothetical protein
VTLRIWQSVPLDAPIGTNSCTGCALQITNKGPCDLDMKGKLKYGCMPHSGYTILKEIKPKA